MSEYLTPPLETDPAEKFDDMVEAIQAVWPDWQPVTTNLDTQILLAVAGLSASDEETASAALTSIFRWFGLNLVPGGQPEDAVAASGTVTIVLNANADGVTIPAGTTYGVDVGEEALLGFELVLDQVFDPGVLTLSAIAVIAGSEGTIGNDRTGELVQIDALEYVESVTFDAASAGGVDAEEDLTYLDRLRALLQLQAPRPIIPDNFSVMALSIPGVERAVTIDGYDPDDHATYDPDDPATWKERFVTVSAIDADGEDVGAAVRTAIDTLFNGDPAQGIKSKREVNFVVVVEPPEYTFVDVTFAALAWPTWAPADVEAAAVAAVESYLSPSLWGQSAFGDARGWENTRAVTIDGLYATLRGVEGLRNVTSLAFGQPGIADDFSTNTIAAYTADTGATSNVSITGGVMQAAANVGTANTLVRLGDQSMRHARRTLKYHVGTSLASGFVAGHALRRVDATNRLIVYVNDSGSASTLRISRIVAGSETVSSTALTRLTVSTNLWIRAWLDGNVVHAEHWLTDPALGGSATTTATYTLTGGDATLFGDGVLGKGGILFQPGHVSAYVDDLKVDGFQEAVPLELIGSPGPVLTRAGTIDGTVTN